MYPVLLLILVMLLLVSVVIVYVYYQQELDRIEQNMQGVEKATNIIDQIE